MMYKQEGQHKNRLLYWVVLSLIFVLPLAWRNSFASTFGQVMGYVTIICIIVGGARSKRLMLSSSVVALAGVVILWLFISVFDSILFYDKFGTLSGENTFTAPLGSIYYHVFYTVLFACYISLVRGKQDVEFTLKKALNTIIWIQIIVGFIQVMIITGVPGISGIYDGIDVLKILPTASFIRGMSRITMTGSEPASMGASLGMLSFPYLLAIMQGSESAKEKTSCTVKLFLLIVLAYFSKSTTVFAIMAVSASIYVLWSSREGNLSQKNTMAGLIIIAVVTIVLLLTSFGGSLHFSNGIFEEIRYYLFVKPTDTANMSTMHRLSPTVNDIALIKKYPLLGVGDGNQGFTYAENVPSYMLINPKSMDFARGIGGVVNGGAWFWAVLSGYGIIGFMAIVIWYFNHFRPKVKQMKYHNVFLYRFFIYAIPAVIVTLLFGAMEPKIIFILSIPFWELITEDKTS